MSSQNSHWSSEEDDEEEDELDPGASGVVVRLARADPPATAMA
jgi:hypothetical protein